MSSYTLEKTTTINNTKTKTIKQIVANKNNSKNQSKKY